jgi:hypothetical protein
MSTLDKIIKQAKCYGAKFDEDEIRKSLSEVDDYYANDDGECDITIEYRKVSAKSMANKSKIIELVESEYGSGAAMAVSELLKENEE